MPDPRHPTSATRHPLLSRRVETPFGSMYVHVEIDTYGRLAGGGISHPRKEPDAQVARMVDALSEGLHALLAEIGGCQITDAR